MPIIPLAPHRALPEIPARRTRRTGVKEMTICGEIQADRRSRLSRKMRVILFFAVEGAAALLIGFAALFLSFEPGWSADPARTAFLRPGDARSGSLLLKTDDGYADASRLGIDVDLTGSSAQATARGHTMSRHTPQHWDS